jgi:hypothetical protein
LPLNLQFMVNIPVFLCVHTTTELNKIENTIIFLKTCKLTFCLPIYRQSISTKSHWYFSSISGQEDLTVPIDNEDWLVRFLRPCKFYPKSALELVSKYF